MKPARPQATSLNQAAAWTRGGAGVGEGEGVDREARQVVALAVEEVTRCQHARLRRGEDADLAVAERAALGVDVAAAAHQDVERGDQVAQVGTVVARGRAILAGHRVLVHADGAAGEREVLAVRAGAIGDQHGADVTAGVVQREQLAVAVGLRQVEHGVFGERERGGAGGLQLDEAAAVDVEVLADILAFMVPATIRIEYPVVQDRRCLRGADGHCEGCGAAEFFKEGHCRVLCVWKSRVFTCK
ncbi:hypothetical protein G4G28_10655 [Massilia sp. Dwa41.01b]|uniref:hypothetical protein n=1 Tax=Massilia sp. Dwa41.01b TaxID=2709302 RepID=UPI0016030155|nr:hypothetical protein G4G28_10655 [Massilia sp. Dwa41.01b]